MCGLSLKKVSQEEWSFINFFFLKRSHKRVVTRQKRFSRGVVSHQKWTYKSGGNSLKMVLQWFYKLENGPPQGVVSY